MKTGNPIYESMLKEYYADPNLTHPERPKVRRTDLHPMVEGYIASMLEDWPLYTVHDIAEYFYLQIIRDCGDFFWRYRDPIGELIWFNENQVLRDIGVMFYNSRHGFEGGFESELLNDGAFNGWDRVIIREQDDQLICIWEDTDDDTTEFEFDFGEVEDDFQFDFS